MGWLYGYHTRADLIRRLTATEENITAEFSLKRWGKRISRTIAHCYRGNVHTGVLWVVHEYRRMRPGSLLLHVDRFIGCYLLNCSGGDWGYKDMEESAHPYYYSCPVSYLKMVPDFFPGVKPEWRNHVYAYHAARAVKRQEKKRNKQLLQDRNVRS